MYANDTIRKLHSAVKDNNLQAVGGLLAKGADVNAADAYQVRPVHIAVDLGHLDILKALILRGCNVNVQAPCKTTKCQEMEEYLTRLYSAVGIFAVFIKNPLSRMFSTGVSFASFVATIRGNLASPLHIAVCKGHLSVVQALISAHAHVNAAYNRMETTPLLIAVSCDYENIVRFLLKRGAVVNARDSNRWTPLHSAAQNGNLNITKLLIQNKAAINAKTQTGDTPLHIAILYRQAEGSEFFINSGADVNARNNEGCTPLIMSALGGHQTETARLLIAKGANVNVKNIIQRTALYYAAENNYTDIVNLLIRNKADVNVTDNFKWTPLHGAATAGNLEIIKILIACGTEVDPLSHEQVTPLHLAAGSWRVEAVKYLLAKGAEVNAPDFENWTPLHFAAQKTVAHTNVLHDFKLNTMKALIENGAHVNAKGSNDETAVLLCIKCGDRIAVKCLLKNGAYNDPEPQTFFEDSCTLS